MARVRLATITMESDSGLPEDRCVNTFHFQKIATPGTVDVYDNILDLVEDFYSAVPSGGVNKVADWLGSSLSGAATIKVYDLDEPEPRVPAAERAVTLDVGGTQLPREMAICCSYRAALVSGAEAARRRGRIYVGPLSDTAADSATGRPAANALLTIQRSARDLLAAAEASVTYQWVVYSPSGDSAADVAEGWVDNAFDVIRKRGDGATVRGRWTDVLPA